MSKWTNFQIKEKIKIILKFVVCRIRIGYCSKAVATGKLTYKHCKECKYHV
jgi:hypothetical protein